MGSVTGMKSKAKRSKQRRVTKVANQNKKVKTCKNCQYGLCAKNADAVFCGITKTVITTVENCKDFYCKAGKAG